MSSITPNKVEVSQLPTRNSDSFTSGVSAFKTALGSARPSFSGSFMNQPNQPQSQHDAQAKRFVDLNQRFIREDYPGEIEIEGDDEDELGDLVPEIRRAPDGALKQSNDFSRVVSEYKLGTNLQRVDGNLFSRSTMSEDSRKVLS